jgi:hypothetical protein
MNADYGRRRPLLIVLVLLMISILLDRYLIAGLCPWVSSLGGISLMVVFLDIPLALPLIDPLPVAVLFSLFYSMTAANSPVRQGEVQGERLSRIWGGVIVLACWMLAGALTYHFTQGLFSRQVRNGIDSFGIHADIHTPFTEYSILHLRGGFILLLCFIIGGRTLVKRINRAAIAHPVPGMISPEKEEIAVLREVPVCTTISVQPPTPVKPRAAVKSVAIVAPRRVEVVREETATPLY